MHLSYTSQSHRSEWRCLKVRIALSFRNYSLEKPPSVSEMIDFANALQLLGTDHVTAEHRDVLLPFLAKTQEKIWTDF